MDARSIRKVQRSLNEQLGLRARDQDAPIDFQLDVAECLTPEDVGNGLAGAAAADALADHTRGRRRDRARRVGDDVGARHAERVRNQELRVQARRVAACRRQRIDGSAERVANVQLAPTEAASSRRRFSSASSAAVNSSSSPAMIAGSPFFVTLTRWSVTRSWGKL